MFSTLYRVGIYKIRSLYVEAFSPLIAKATICETLRLLEAARESGTIGCWMSLSVCVFVFHIKLFHLLPPLIPLLLMWTSTSHNPSLSLSLSIRELAARIR